MTAKAQRVGTAARMLAAFGKRWRRTRNRHVAALAIVVDADGALSILCSDRRPKAVAALLRDAVDAVEGECAETAPIDSKGRVVAAFNPNAANAPMVH